MDFEADTAQSLVGGVAQFDENGCVRVPVHSILHGTLTGRCFCLDVIVRGDPQCLHDVGGRCCPPDLAIRLREVLARYGDRGDDDPGRYVPLQKGVQRRQGLGGSLSVWVLRGHALDHPAPGEFEGDLTTEVNRRPSRRAAATVAMAG